MYGSNGATDFNDVSDITVPGNMFLLYAFTFSNYAGTWSPNMNIYY